MGRKKKPRVDQAPEAAAEENSTPLSMMIPKKERIALPPPPSSSALASAVLLSPPPTGDVPSFPPPPPASLPPPSSITDNSVVESEQSAKIKSATLQTKSQEIIDEADLGTKPSSQYGLHSHSGDLIEEDIYVSDGSLSSQEEENEILEEDGADGDAPLDNKKDGNKNKQLELVITTSKMGLMRRGGISSLLNTQVNRTWVRDEKTATDENNETSNNNTQQQSEQSQETEIITDPAQLLLLQQQKIEAAKQSARILESSENAGRDPCLFSKRTAFDIRMDQIEDKPWTTGGDLTDYFNYGLSEEDWMEYSERQLNVRQELTDASKQKRLPDPAIVQVVPRAPKVQGDRVAVRVKKESSDENNEEEVEDENKGMGGDSDG
mmetsp:Transcript_19959/g.32787  ORF Transcript_19959/g.32787 Transcript_19959/m.32787 type:complete len:379 (+) Transcript_19959:133-1269(+)